MRSIWSWFWSKAGAVGIRIKIMGIVAVCIMIAAVVMVWYTYSNVGATLRIQLREQGIAIGQSVVVQSRDMILTDNQVALYRLVKDMQNAYKDITYILVLDTSNNVLVHTFDEGLPVDLLGRNEITSGEPYKIQILRSENGIIQDIAFPVLSGKAGTIRLGISESTIDIIIGQQIQNILLWIILILVIGLFVAYGLSYILTEPIARLAESTKKIGKYDFTWRKPIWAKDEVGSLGEAFTKMNKELQHKEKLRKQLLAKVISAQEEERKRIARELHDETSQALTSLMVGLRFVRDSTNTHDIRAKTTELRTLTSQTLNEVHRIAAELRNRLLDDLGLIDAIQKYTDEYSHKFNIKIDFHISGISKLHLPSEIEVSVFRIIQEALTNTAKYAEAKNVSIVLSCRDTLLIVIVEDDGKGFDTSFVFVPRNTEKLGIFGMHERASLLGGNLTIESKPGDGTTVFLEVPLNLEEEISDEEDQTITSR
jgi:signal transduction histidine kinase